MVIERRLHFVMPGPLARPRTAACGRKGMLRRYESGALAMSGNGHTSYCTTKTMLVSCPRCREVLGLVDDDSNQW